MLLFNQMPEDIQSSTPPEQTHEESMVSRVQNIRNTIDNLMGISKNRADQMTGEYAIDLGDYRRLDCVLFGAEKNEGDITLRMGRGRGYIGIRISKSRGYSIQVENRGRDYSIEDNQVVQLLHKKNESGVWVTETKPLDSKELLRVEGLVGAVTFAISEAFD